MKHYTARWTAYGETVARGNVSFHARSDYHAIQMADKIGREIGLPNTPRTIHEGVRLVHRKE